MAEQEKQPLTASDSTVSGSTQTGRAVALARLLHQECIQLLERFKERETSLSDQTPDGGRMVSLSSEATESTTEEQVRLLHSALRQCLGMIHCVIQKEEEEWGRLEDDYETLKASVRARLENLLHTTKALLRSKDETLEVTPDHQCNEEVDGMGGTFGLKMWTYRVLLELIHWADQAAKTLHDLHAEREGTKKSSQCRSSINLFSTLDKQSYLRPPMSFGGRGDASMRLTSIPTNAPLRDVTLGIYPCRPYQKPPLGDNHSAVQNAWVPQAQLLLRAAISNLLSHRATFPCDFPT